MTRYDKSARILDIYERLCRGAVIQKTAEAQRFHVDVRSIQRDIDDIRAYLAGRTDAAPGEPHQLPGLPGQQPEDQQHHKADGQNDGQLGEHFLPQGHRQINLIQRIIDKYFIKQEQQRLQNYGAHDPPEDFVEDLVLLLRTLRLLFFSVHASISCARHPPPVSRDKAAFEIINLV